MRIVALLLSGGSALGLGAELPKSYTCCRAGEALVIDGKLDEAAWKNARATDKFVDIEGDKKPKPYQDTTVKMLWDDKYFYFGAELKEMHLWATLTKRDSIIFYDNDFEIFLDDDGDTHNYAEFEINALNTVWDLFLPRPYREGGPPLHAWDMVGIQHAVHLDGTLNDPSDEDRGWTVEVAIPWESLKLGFSRQRAAPEVGEVWRVNFSRVHYDLVADTNAKSGYRKKTGPDGKKLPEYNWVWSPQGVIAMHEPEHWGKVLFSAKEPGSEEKLPARVLRMEPVRAEMYRFYRAQEKHIGEKGEATKSVKELGSFDFGRNLVSYQASGDRFSLEITIPNTATLRLTEQGRLQVK